MIEKKYPDKIDKLLNGEKPDFIISGRNTTGAKILIAFSFIFIVILVIVTLLTLNPIFGGQITQDNTFSEILIFKIIFLVLFVVFCIGILIWAISLYKKKTWYISTPSKLIIYTNTTTKEIEWKYFVGQITYSGDSSKGLITLSVKKERDNQLSLKNESLGGYHYLAPVFISGIKHVNEIESIVRGRINNELNKLD